LIRQPNYEVGREFVDRFTALDAANQEFFVASARRRHAMFDCRATSARGFERAEIQSIDDLQLCTDADPARFFSYRRTTHRGEPDTDVTSMRWRWQTDSLDPAPI